MLKELEKLVPSIFKLGDETVDVTTDEGIEKIRESVADAKVALNSLFTGWLLDKGMLKSFSNELDEILERAEQKYVEAHNKEEEEEYEEQSEEDVRPVLLLTTEEASEVYDMVEAYLEDKIYPKLPEDTTQEFVNSIRESLADFAAWCIKDNDAE